MKKIIPLFAAVLLLTSCAIFRKKEKYGCPNDARGKSQDEIRDKAAKGKFKGGSKMP